MPATPIKKKVKSPSAPLRREQPFFALEAEWERPPPRTDYQTCVHRLRRLLRETAPLARAGDEVNEQLIMIFLIVKELEQILYLGEWGGSGSKDGRVLDELLGVKNAAEKLVGNTTGKAVEELASKVESVGKTCLEGWFH